MERPRNVVVYTFGLCLLVTAPLFGCKNEVQTAEAPPKEEAEPVEGQAPRVAKPSKLAVAEEMKRADRLARVEVVTDALGQTEEARLVAMAWIGAQSDATGWYTLVVGTRSGFPAFQVIHPTEPSRTIVVLPETVGGEEAIGGSGDASKPDVAARVLEGEDGLERYLALRPDAAPTELASAWLVLAAGLAVEPQGPWDSTESKGPEKRKDEIVFSYVDPETGAQNTGSIELRRNKIVYKPLR